MADLSQICAQRQLGMTFNIPPVRFKPKTPYIYDENGNLLFSKHQLDMRRKVEILKYNKGPQSQPSKKSYFSQLVNSRSVRSTIVCPNVGSLSTSADVPGPPILLLEDSDVPLYNYTSPVRTFSFLNDDKTAELLFQKISPNPLRYFIPSTSNLLCYMKILPAMDESSKIISLQIPFSLGYTTTDPLSFYSGNISVSNVELSTFYNSQSVDTGVPSYSIDISNTSFSLSKGNRINQVGMITISNVFLYTFVNVIYEFDLSFSLQTNFSQSYVYIDTNNVVLSVN